METFDPTQEVSQVMYVLTHAELLKFKRVLKRSELQPETKLLLEAKGYYVHQIIFAAPWTVAIFKQKPQGINPPIRIPSEYSKTIGEYTICY